MPENINEIAEILGKAAATRLWAEVDAVFVRRMEEDFSRPPHKICGKWIVQVLGNLDEDSWEISGVGLTRTSYSFPTTAVLVNGTWPLG